jgi:hypothetical protein
VNIKRHRREVEMADLEKIKKIINDPGTSKIVGTVGVDGVPHTALKQTLHLNEDGNIEFVELLESSVSFKNITGSIWFDKKVSILVLGANRESYEITGKVDRILIAGRKFEEIYSKILQDKGFDIAAVVIIIPEKVDNKSAKDKFEEQESTRMFYKHLDRLSIEE